MNDAASIGGKFRANKVKTRLLAVQTTWDNIHEGSYCPDGQGHVFKLPERVLECWNQCVGCGEWRRFTDLPDGFYETLDV